METICLHDSTEVESILRHHTYLHIYELGDLDDPHWEHTTWYGIGDEDRVREVLLVYTGLVTPVLLALSDKPATHMQELLRSVMPCLPHRFYAHLSNGLSRTLEDRYAVRSLGPHLKMALLDPTRLSGADTSEAVPITLAQVEELQSFYDRSYPDNWFEPQMLARGHYYGV